MARLAILDKAKCVNKSQCNFLCHLYCPEVRMGNEAVIEDDDGKALIDENICTGCGICVNKCPVSCIQIINLPKELDQTAVHRYSQNGFKLFSLPVPKFGSIIGIIGRNGIGKSTSIKILSGEITPNFEDFELKDKEESYRKLIEKYKGKEQQKYFEKLRDGDIKISYKPQEIESIPRLFKGKVIELLKKISNDENKLNELVTKLELDNILDRNIDVISGGELQKVALAASLLKEANVYLLDEPTSYLDLKGRLTIAKFLREFIENNPDKAIMVIEHDLITLDYLSDYIYAIYGKPSAYGVCSQIKSTNQGINEYLSGMLKNENVRIRDKEIRYDLRTHSKKLKKIELVSWDELNLKLGAFKLKAKKGVINNHRITGILGENGIGKTTFMRILAGEFKEFKDKISMDVKISYKPQYIKRNDRLVKDVLKEALSKSKEAVSQFEVSAIMDKKISELSGGELQKIAILESITKDADIYLLDEPSTFLDIEERLRLYRIIRSIIYDKDKTALIIDHDLLFIDYIADEIMLFTGEPGKVGLVDDPKDMVEGMNNFLKEMNITMRRDMYSKRPRINKDGSQLDMKQRDSGKWYGV